MSLELVNTLASLFTATVVAAAAIAALIQLRHLRAGNQINAMLSIGEEFNEPRFTDARTFCRTHLAAALDDPLFREYFRSYGRDAAVVPEVNPQYQKLREAAVLLANACEELGILIKKGVIDQELFLDRYCWVILDFWKQLGALVVAAREATGNPAIWENFEYLTVLSDDWLRDHPTSYPKGARRMPVKRWPQQVVRHPPDHDPVL